MCNNKDFHKKQAPVCKLMIRLGVEVALPLKCPVCGTEMELGRCDKHEEFVESVFVSSYKRLRVIDEKGTFYFYCYRCHSELSVPFLQSGVYRTDRIIIGR